MKFSDLNTTIQRALEAAGLQPKADTLGAVSRSLGAVDATMRRVFERTGLAPMERARPVAAGAQPAGESAAAGQFVTRRHSGAEGSRDYKLYIPSTLGAAAAGGAGQGAAPLILMLHGCKQNPDDFAAGTRMNELAEVHGFLVAYPAQTVHANGSNCWNWFQGKDQQREAGEPALLKGIVDDVRRAHAVDAGRVFVAGLSAGAAMAVILGATYPEVFSAVGAHSGLPYAAAHDVASAFAAMHGGAMFGAGPGSRSASEAARAAGMRAAVRTIVFHGEQDHTVARSNGEAIVAQAVAAFEASGEALVVAHDAEGQAHGFTSTRYSKADGHVCVEDWKLRGVAHAWSGGSAAGSYTDPLGPDASAAMLRFFLAA